MPDGKLVVHTNTPSYVGSHINGFFNMMIGFMNYLTKKTGTPTGKTAVFPGWVNPGDIRELKRIAAMMNVPAVFFPDQSGVLHAPMTGRYEFYPEGGTTLDEIRTLGDSDGLIALGEIIGVEPAESLNKKCKVPYTLLPLPVGVAYTDQYVLALRKQSHTELPAALEEERGRLVYLMLDSSQYTSGKKVAIFGDPDIVIGLTSLALEWAWFPSTSLPGRPKRSLPAKSRNSSRSTAQRTARPKRAPTSSSCTSG